MGTRGPDWRIFGVARFYGAPRGGPALIGRRRVACRSAFSESFVERALKITRAILVARRPAKGQSHHSLTI